MKKITIIFLAALIVMITVGLYHIFPAHSILADINGHKFKLEPATNEKERARGLSGRKELCQECGMLFIFPEKGIYRFWMKGMRFDLDIIWINEGKIAELAKNVARSNNATIDPKKPADQVLEINAGLSEKYGLKEGDQVRFSY